MLLLITDHSEIQTYLVYVLEQQHHLEAHVVREDDHGE